MTAPCLTLPTSCWLRSVAEPRLLWERVEKLVPRQTGNSGSGGSSSSSSSSNSSSQPGSHCGSGERLRARCESAHSTINLKTALISPRQRRHPAEPFDSSVTWTDRLTSLPSLSLVQIRGLAPPPSRGCWEKAGGEAGLGPAEQTSGERVDLQPLAPSCWC